MDAKTESKSATLTVGNNNYDFPILSGTVGPDVIDIRKLYAQTGKFTYDPGFLSTASCNSTITYIDGDKGELLYRGYPIEQLAQNCDFMEVCYLLLKGELPNPTQKAEFDKLVTMREELRQMWTRTNVSAEQLVADLQAWCRRAEESGIAELRSFVVHGQYRDRGVGKEMAMAAVEEGERRNIREILVVTSSRDYFEKLGFSDCLHEKYALFWKGKKKQ